MSLSGHAPPSHLLCRQDVAEWPGRPGTLWDPGPGHRTWLGRTSFQFKQRQKKRPRSGLASSRCLGECDQRSGTAAPGYPTPCLGTGRPPGKASSLEPSRKTTTAGLASPQLRSSRHQRPRPRAPARPRRPDPPPDHSDAASRPLQAASLGGSSLATTAVERRPQLSLPAGPQPAPPFSWSAPQRPCSGACRAQEPLSQGGAKLQPQQLPAVTGSLRR